MAGEDELLALLRQGYDPEVGINVVDLGLIYGVAQHGDCVHVELTLTTPGCPLHDAIGQAVQRASAGARRRPRGGRAGLGSTLDADDDHRCGPTRAGLGVKESERSYDGRSRHG
jgi:hypothetical protein